MTDTPDNLVTLDALDTLADPSGADLLPIQRTQPAEALRSVSAQALKDFMVNSVRAYGAVGDGIADDTAAIQSAINTGLPFHFPPGVYRITQSLRFTVSANHGQVVRGSGPVAVDGSGAGKTVIRPSADCAVAILIDGAPFNGYVQGFGIEDLTIDMVNMPDAPTSVGILQGQAFDCSYSNIRISNFGNQSSSWRFVAGAYTTRLSNCQGGLIAFQGNGYFDQTTSVALINCDIYRIEHAYFSNVSLVGGAVQRPYSTNMQIMYLPPGTTPYGYPPNTTGLYAAVLSDISYAYSFSSVGTDWEQGGGFPPQYDDGIHGNLPLIRVICVQSTCLNTTFINPTFAGMYLLDRGINTRVIGQPIGSGDGADIVSGQQINLRPIVTSSSVIGAGDVASYLDHGATTTFSIDGRSGAASFFTLTLRPSMNADQTLLVRDATGLPLYDFTTNGAGLAILNGSSISGYTDSFSSQSWIIDGHNGAAKFRSLVLWPSSDGNSVLLWKNATGSVLLGLNTAPAGSSSSIYLENGITLNAFSDGGNSQTWSASAATGNITAQSIQVGTTSAPTGGISTNGQVRTVGVTFASLPPAAAIGNGTRGFIVDGTLAAAGNYGIAITGGGGSNQIPVYSDGTNWRIG